MRKTIIQQYFFLLSTVRSTVNTWMAFKRDPRRVVQSTHHCQHYQFETFRLQVYENILILNRYSILASMGTVIGDDS